MQYFSTKPLPPRTKVAYWNDVICDRFTKMQTEVRHGEPFEAALDAGALGPLSFSKVYSRPAQVVRGRRHLSQNSKHDFFLHLQLKGRLSACQQGKEAVLDEGDLVLCDSSMPYSLTYDEPCSTMVLGVPARILRNHLPFPEDIVARKLDGQRGLGQTLGGMMESIWGQMSDGSLADQGERVAGSILNIYAAACSHMQGSPVRETAVAGARRIQIARYIEANLRDPDLSVSSVAAAFRISRRYLHMLFASQDETISNYILRRRIEECAKQLSSKTWQGRTITEIAFSWGFNNTTHFARVFRNHYGQSPRDFRKSA